jgi:hypothetical protein
MQPDILAQTLMHARIAWRSGDRPAWAARVASGVRVESQRRQARRIARRGGRASVPHADRLAQRLPNG